MQGPLSLTAQQDDNNRRLDRILRKACPRLPLSHIQRLLRTGGVKVDGKRANGSQRVLSGQHIEINTVNVPEVGQRNEARKKAGPALSIIYEGAGLLIVNKPAGIPVQGPGPSLADQVCAYLEPRLSSSLSFRPGPLHRLDRGASGIVCFGASLEGAQVFSRLMQERLLKKTYLALVRGHVETQQRWEDGLERDKEKKRTFSSKSSRAKAAISIAAPLKYGLLDSGLPWTLLQVEIETGRTHQIRAQAVLHGHPLLGDVKYSKTTAGLPAGAGYFLHAWRLQFPADPRLAPELDARLFEAPLPNTGKFHNFLL
jgi:23S rRNA pseudouridine955/2504/2580 synthase